MNSGQNFELIDYPIKLVLIGESPLRSENYIYNNGNTKGSPFLPEKHINHCLTLLGKDIPPSEEENKRPALMNELGLLVLDMFPFAFNKGKTRFLYSRKRLDEEIKRLYLIACFASFFKSLLLDTSSSASKSVLPVACK